MIGALQATAMLTLPRHSWAAETPPKMIVTHDPNCGCCGGWVAHVTGCRIGRVIARDARQYLAEHHARPRPEERFSRHHAFRGNTALDGDPGRHWCDRFGDHKRLTAATLRIQSVRRTMAVRLCCRCRRSFAHSRSFKRMVCAAISSDWVAAIRMSCFRLTFRSGSWGRPPGVFRRGIRALTRSWCSSVYSAPTSLA